MIIKLINWFVLYGNKMVSWKSELRIKGPFKCDLKCLFRFVFNLFVFFHLMINIVPHIEQTLKLSVHLTKKKPHLILVDLTYSFNMIPLSTQSYVFNLHEIEGV